MISNLPLPSSLGDANNEATRTATHRLSTSKTDAHITRSPPDQQTSSLSYLSIPIGGNRCFTSTSDFQDPFFYQQPLHLDHKNRSILSTNKSGYDRGDRIRLTTESTFTEQKKEKKKSTQRKHTISKRKNEQRKKPSTKRLHQRNHKTRKTNRTTTRPLRQQTKTRQELRRKRDAISKKNKKQRTRSTSTRHNRGKNVNNHRTLSSRRSLSSKSKVRSNAATVTRRSVPSNKSLTTSITRLLTDGSGELALQKIKEQAQLSSSHPRMNEDEIIGKILTQSAVDSSQAKLSQKFATQLKRQNHCSTKLNIRSPTHTTFTKSIQRHRKGISERRQRTYPQCSSKTLITIASPITKTDQLTLKSSTTKSSVSSKKHLINKRSSTSTGMPLTKNTARITSKNNNRRALQTKRRGAPKSGSRVISSMTKGMTLRSRTIMINKS